jgi:glyoxylase I family protein
MVTEVIGIDHIYLSVRDLAVSENYFDTVLGEILGFRKNKFVLNGNPHVQYFNRQFGFVVRPASKATAFDGEAPGLHHFCFRVTTEEDVDRVASAMRAKGLQVSIPQYHKEYAPDYYAIFFTDPDGLKLEVTNFRQERRERMYQWDSLPG